MKKRILYSLLAMILMVVTASGCSVWNSLFEEEGSEIDLLPQDLAYQGMEELNAGNYQTAADTFQKLKDRYPFSKYAILAELKMADALFLKQKYVEAADAYTEFERLHPKNEAVPYVIYQLGMCYYNLMKGPDRDQEPSVRAIQTFVRLRQTYPESKFASMAEARLTEAQLSLAGHEFYVGEYYMSTGSYRAALGRFISLIKNYPDTGYHSRALDNIRICRVKLQEEQAARAAEAPEEVDGPGGDADLGQPPLDMQAPRPLDEEAPEEVPMLDQADENLTGPEETAPEEAAAGLGGPEDEGSAPEGGEAEVPALEEAEPGPADDPGPPEEASPPEEAEAGGDDEVVPVGQ